MIPYSHVSPNPSHPDPASHLHSDYDTASSRTAQLEHHGPVYPVVPAPHPLVQTPTAAAYRLPEYNLELRLQISIPLPAKPAHCKLLTFLDNTLLLPPRPTHRSSSQLVLIITLLHRIPMHIFREIRLVFVGVVVEVCGLDRVCNGLRGGGGAVF